MAGGLCVASRNSRIFPERQYIYQRSDEADDSEVIYINSPAYFYLIHLGWVKSLLLWFGTTELYEHDF